jgi:hypothetical protein
LVAAATAIVVGHSTVAAQEAAGDAVPVVGHRPDSGAPVVPKIVPPCGPSVVVAVPKPPSGPPQEPAVSGGGIFFDQDWLWLADKYNMDRNYTMGLAFQISGRFIESSHLDDVVNAFDWLTGVDRLREATREISVDPAGNKFWLESHSLTLGNGAFTPDNLNTAAPIFDDRPYASLLFLAIGHSTIFPGNSSRRAYVWSSELSIGVLGLHIADWVQTNIHAAMRRSSGQLTPYAPLGWHNQISDGGELTARYLVAHQHELSESRFHDLRLTFEASVGYYTNVAAGAAFRFGRIRSSPWTLNSNPISSGNQAESTERPCCAPIRTWKDWELYGFLAGRMRLVAYNALLQGQFRDSAVTLSAGEIERVVNEFETGFVLGGAGFSLTFMLIGGRTPEYHIPNVAPRTHTWGGVYLTWLMPSP